MRPPHQRAAAFAHEKCRVAIADFRAAERADPQSVGGYWRAAMAEDAHAWSVGNFKLFYDASHDLDRAVAIAPKSAFLYTLRGLTTQYEMYDVTSSANVISMFGEAYTGSYIVDLILGDEQFGFQAYVDTQKQYQAAQVAQAKRSARATANALGIFAFIVRQAAADAPTASTCPMYTVQVGDSCYYEEP